MHTQSAPCAISPQNKKKHARQVGEDLIRHHGKRSFYSVRQVRAANERCEIPLDLTCWSYALYSTRADFDGLHSGAGEACDYADMKAQMLESLSGKDSSDWFDFDFDLSWLEFPDIDMSIFDLFD